MFQMPEKSAANQTLHWVLKVTPLAFFLGIFVVWVIGGLDVGGFHRDLLVLDLSSSRKDLSLDDFSFQLNLSFSDKPHRNLTLFPENLALDIAPSSSPLLDSTSNQHDSANISSNSSYGGEYSGGAPSLSRPGRWISAELGDDYSENLLKNWLAPGGEPCTDSRTVGIKIPKLDDRGDIVLSAGEIHEFVFQAVDDSGSPHCIGGDYFETDLSGDQWKSRPPVRDFGNGTYSFDLQVHPDFPGDYNLTIILLFRHFEGLKFSPERFAYDVVLRTIPIKFRSSSSSSSAKLPEIQQCRESDFTRDVWSGRWTRHARNDSCSIGADGRYRCQEPDFPCEHPWCSGRLGLIESNGWVYSAHCSFKLYSGEEAWRCLRDRWIFWWGDSNHCDTIRNMLNFIMDVSDIKSVPRLFDMNITNPKNRSETVRFTSIFNGHHNASGNYQGLNSLSDEQYRDKLRGYFSSEAVPDTVIMNSGLHDGVYWSNVRKFVKGAEYMARFWSEVMVGVRGRGASVPEVVYRTTVATGGYARRLAFNPNKMEAFNGVVLDKMRKYGLVDRVVDGFDMTYPWHFDNRCNDGVHYGRAPLKMRWRDGLVGHQYFVDLMLGHVLLNALCAR